MGNKRYERYRETIRRGSKRYYWENREKCVAYANARQDSVKFNGKRIIVMARDNYRCNICDMTNDEHISLFGRQLTIHHIDGNGIKRNNPNNDIDNLVTLCSRCHGIIDKEEALYNETIN